MDIKEILDTIKSVKLCTYAPIATSPEALGFIQIKG